MKTLAFLLLARISGPTAIATRRYDVVAVAGFSALCAFFAVWPIWRAFFPMEIDLKEPWNAYHADAVVQNGILYPDLGGLVANNYPPFWYYLTGALSGFGGDAISIGSAVSFAALIAVAAAIALCIRRFNAGWPAAMLGALFFLGAMVRFADWYVAMTDPHVPALALMTIALLWFLRRDPGEGHRAAAPAHGRGRLLQAGAGRDPGDGAVPLGLPQYAAGIARGARRGRGGARAARAVHGDLRDCVCRSDVLLPARNLA
jgi:hypothetical protein